MPRTKRAQRIPLAEVLTPIDMGCAVCGDGTRMLVYPSPDGKGIGVCPNCSPAWLPEYARYQLDRYRAEYHLPPLLDGPNSDYSE